MRKCLFGSSIALLILTAGAAAFGPQDNAARPDQKRPKLSLKVRPEIGIAPMRVVLTAEFEGGSDDFEEYYCPTTVWEWGDGSVSEAASDCAPYEAGKSAIKRRYTVEHTYRRSGRLRVYFSIRHHDKEVAATGANLTIQPGGTDNSE